MAEENTFSLTKKITDKALIVTLPPHCKTLTTSVYGGGLRNDVTHFFNFDLKNEEGQCELHEKTYEKELIAITKELKLPIATTVGMTTAVSMKDLVMKTKTARNLQVTAFITAGIENNGGCAGDPASYYEEDHQQFFQCGTINIMLFINADVPDGILFRGAITATEGKTAAIRELQLPSCYSMDLATGSGTDGFFIVSHSDSALKRTDTGKHALLGELIGSVVRDGVKEALLRHMDTKLTNMRIMENRLKRFGLCSGGFETYLANNDIKISGKKVWEAANTQIDIAQKTTLLAALWDNVRWGHFPKENAVKEGKQILAMEQSRAKDFDALFYDYLIKNRT